MVSCEKCASESQYGSDYTSAEGSPTCNLCVRESYMDDGECFEKPEGVIRTHAGTTLESMSLERGWYRSVSQAQGCAAWCLLPSQPSAPDASASPSHSTASPTRQLPATRDPRSLDRFAPSTAGVYLCPSILNCRGGKIRSNESTDTSLCRDGSYGYVREQKQKAHPSFLGAGPVREQY